ncbi:MAG: hypothetical protein HZY77_12825 [Thiobacillus sp.]|uniref:hypothetical protein n=1 Tax=Thiobacillus sp. TaxID=924 RepID=UPI00168C841A|nr:hypothetical protein [Thiobacillus sp.]QLQ03521.1 MAG: hypothetical protein HZY77_12825 [Thiobacillus sp.]
MPGSKFLSLSRQRKEPKKGDPDIPETPKIKRVGWAAKNSPRFCRVDLIFVSGAQTPLPLIHPTRLIFGGAVRGSQNQGSSGRMFATTILASPIRRITPMAHAPERAIETYFTTISLIPN